MKEVHESHKMSEWESAIVTLVSTPRFGQIRFCLDCGAEHGKTVAGEALEDELLKPCWVNTK